VNYILEKNLVKRKDSQFSQVWWVI